MTLATDDDVLNAARRLGIERNGIPRLKSRANVMVTIDVVNALRDEAP